MKINNRFVILGTNGHGLAALDAAREMGDCEFVGWLDSFRSSGEVVANAPILGHPDQLAELMVKHNFGKLFIAVSHNYTRYEIATKLQKMTPQLEFLTIKHPRSIISTTAKIGDGSLIMAGAVIATGCTVGEQCIVDLNSVLDHDSEMRPYASLLPSCTTGGDVTVGSCVCVCLGTVISHRLTIGDHAFIGAGSVVLKDVPESTIAYGFPAKSIRTRESNEKHF